MCWKSEYLAARACGGRSRAAYVLDVVVPCGRGWRGGVRSEDDRCVDRRIRNTGDSGVHLSWVW